MLKVDQNWYFLAFFLKVWLLVSNIHEKGLKGANNINNSFESNEWEKIIEGKYRKGYLLVFLRKRVHLALLSLLTLSLVVNQGNEKVELRILGSVWPHSVIGSSGVTSIEWNWRGSGWKVLNCSCRCKKYLI